jgi:glyoxylase-like metal-dependent hydrolase (beta-lactamase superfamily II)
MSSRRFAVLFLALATCLAPRAQPANPPAELPVLVTDENQRVAFDQTIWQFRELAKVLPLDEPWPRGAPQLQAAFAKYGLNQATPPKVLPIPARLARDVYLVGQAGVGGNNLTYLVDCGEAGLALIDPTYESEVEPTLAQVEKAGFAPDRIRWVLNTHCHVDHAMADAAFHRRGAQIIAGAADADAIVKGTRVTAYYIVESLNATDPRTGEKRGFPKCPVGHRLADGEELRLGNKTFHVIHTPGHTPGSVCFLLQLDGKNLLFSGDTVLYDARLGWQGNPYADNTAYVASLEKLANFKLEPRRSEPFQFDLLLPGHGAISMDRAYLDIDKALEHTRWQLGNLGRVESTPFSTSYYRQLMFGRPRTPAAP